MNMNSRTKSVGIIIGTLLAGILLGSVITGAVYQNRAEKQERLRKPGGFVEHLEEMVDPHDEAQWQTIYPIVEKTGRRHREIMNGARTALNASFDSMLVELAPHLDADQMERLKEKQAKMRRKLSGPPGPHGGGGGPHGPEGPPPGR